MMRPIDNLVAGGSLSASEMARVFREIERNTRITVEAPLEIARQGTGYHIRLSDRSEEFWAKVTRAGTPGGSGSGSGSGGGSGSSARPVYSWVEYDSWTKLPVAGGRSGSALFCPAYEVNDTNADGRIVRLRREASAVMSTFTLGSGGSGSGSGFGGAVVFQPIVRYSFQFEGFPVPAGPCRPLVTRAYCGSGDILNDFVLYRTGPGGVMYECNGTDSGSGSGSGGG